MGQCCGKRGAERAVCRRNREARSGAAKTANGAALIGSTGFAYLDDLGVNLKPAREMSMTTIKVINAKQAIAELEKATALG
jgi:hypothetical protein